MWFKKLYRWQIINDQGNYVEIESITQPPNSTCLKKSMVLKIGFKKLSWHWTFWQQLAQHLSLHVHIDQALEWMAKRSAHPHQKRLLQSLLQAMRRGAQLPAVMRSHPEAFSTVHCAAIEGGLLSGRLAEMLNTVATCEKTRFYRKKQLLKVLIYPLSLLMATLTLLFFLMHFSIPLIQSLYNGFGKPLPVYTQQLLFWYHQAKWFVPAFALLTGLGCYGYKASTKLQYFCHHLLFKIPLYRDWQWSIWSSLVSLLLQARIPLFQSLLLVEQSLQNLYFKRQSALCRQALTKGSTLEAAFQVFKHFPNRYRLHHTFFSEQAWSDYWMQTAAALHQDVTQEWEALMSVMEPMLMLVMAILVGAVITALYEPILNLGRVI